MARQRDDRLRMAHEPSRVCPNRAAVGRRRCVHDYNGRAPLEALRQALRYDRRSMSGRRERSDHDDQAERAPLVTHAAALGHPIEDPSAQAWRAARL